MVKRFEIEFISVHRYNYYKKRSQIVMIKEILKDKNMSQYRLSKESGIPYTTINDICSNKTRIEKCSAETVFRIARVLGVSMESIIEPCLDVRTDFELFKSNVCHKLKELGDIEFLIELLEEDYITMYYEKEWYPEALYLLAMLDYLSRENEIPICTKYDNLRTLKLETMMIPSSVKMASIVSNSDDIILRSIEEAIPEFLQFNIVESEIRNVV